LERFEAILEIPVLRRGSLAHRQRVPLGAAQKSPAWAACTRRAAAHAEDGDGRRICLARNSALAEGEIRRTQPLSAERVGLKAAHNRGNELAMGSSRGPLLARDKDLRNGWRAEPATSLPRSGPALAARSWWPSCSAPFGGRMNRGKCRFAGNCLIVDAMVAPRGAHAPHTDGRRWPPRIPLNDKAVDARVYCR
jgi:hypothetical protein